MASNKPPAAAKTIIHRKGASHPFVGVARFADYNAGQGLVVQDGCRDDRQMQRGTGTAQGIPC